jgi:hypothetical protein
MGKKYPYLFIWSEFNTENDLFIHQKFKNCKQAIQAKKANKNPLAFYKNLYLG